MRWRKRKAASATSAPATARLRTPPPSGASTTGIEAGAKSKIRPARDGHHIMPPVTGPESLPTHEPMEGTMANAITETFATPRPETHHYIGAVPIALCTRFIEAARERREQR